MTSDDGIFLWVALVAICALALSSWILVELVYLTRRIYSSLRYWWLYGRHGAAYTRSVAVLKRRYVRMQEASKRFGKLRFTTERGEK